MSRPRVRSRLSILATVALLGCGTTTRASEDPNTRHIARADLVRCDEAVDMPCMRAVVALDPSEMRSTMFGQAEELEWRGSLGTLPLQAIASRVVSDATAPTLLLVLVDVSGSMAGDGIQSTRAALRSFLMELQPAAVRVAIVPFSSWSVDAGVRAAQFTTPAAAMAAVDRLPAPGGNTGLYSAVRAAAEVVDEAARRAPAGTRGAVLVVTDGRNDVSPGVIAARADDPGLLVGEQGRAIAVASARRVGVPLYCIGLGATPDMTELAAIAGETGAAFRVAEDAVALRGTLARINTALSPLREITFALPGADRGWIGQSGSTLAVWQQRRSTDSVASAVHTAPWSVPVFLLPAYSGVAAHDVAVKWRGNFANTSHLFVWRRVALAGCTGIVLLTLCLAGPVVGRTSKAPLPHTSDTVATRRGDGAVRRIRLHPIERGQGHALVGGALRRDVKDAPPRRPADVTASATRRTNRQVGKRPST